MNTLLLRLAGPMQSWGTESRFRDRDTGLEPSKSGVLGLVCAAIGRPRWESLDDMVLLRMGVRVDREGVVSRDYQTTLDVIKASGERPRQGEAIVSSRYYLADALFLVGLEGDDDALPLLHTIDSGLHSPVWPLFLGRKAFPPSIPLFLEDGLRRGEDLRTALYSYPLAACGTSGQKEQVRLVQEGPEGELVRIDQSLGSAEDRRFGPRHVAVTFRPRCEFATREDRLCISHG